MNKCQRCGEPSSKTCKTFCEPHRIEHQNYVKNRHERLRAEGRCLRCAKPSKRSTTLCSHCYERSKHSPTRRAWIERNKDRLRSLAKERTRRRRFGGLYYKILIRDGNACKVCRSRLHLHVHHIDGHGYGTKDPHNTIKNLVVLCARCHSLIGLISRHPDIYKLLLVCHVRKSLSSQQP